MIRRGLGYRQDFYDPRDLDMARMLARRGTPARFAEPDLRHLRKRVLDQGSAGSCFAFATASAIHKSLLIQHGEQLNIPFPSPLALYWFGRAQEYKGGEPPKSLPDSGTYPRPGMNAIRAVGFPSEADCPYSDHPSAIGLPPNASAIRKAFDQRSFMYARISETGHARADAIADALMAGCPCTIGMQVDTPFINNAGSMVRRIEASMVAGGHMMELAAIIDRGGERCAVVQNSWSAAWGDNGFGYVSLDVLGSPWVTDVYSIIAAPIYAVEPK